MMSQSGFWVSARFAFLMVGMFLGLSSPAREFASLGEGGSLGEGAGKAVSGRTSERLASDDDSDRNQATESVLDSLELDFAFGDQQSFKQVLGELNELTGLKFFLDPSAEDGDLTRDTEIEFSAESLRLRTGLKMMLVKYNATFVIRDGLVVILSLDAASDPNFFRRKMFDVENLLQLMIRTQGIKDKTLLLPAELLSRDGSPGSLGIGGMGGIGGGFMHNLPLPKQDGDVTGAGQEGVAADEGEKARVEGAQEPAEAKVIEEAAGARSVGQSAVNPTNLLPVTYPARNTADTRLVELIQAQVCPDEWADTGNGNGVIQVVGGVLVVSQTEDVLNQVGGMLREMEAKLNAIDARAKKE